MRRQEIGLAGIGIVFGVAVVQAAVATSQPAARIVADFPGGNIVLEGIEEDRVLLRPDLRDTTSWWFYWYFGVRGAAGRTLNFRFTDRNPIGVHGPAVSTDGGKSWSWLGADAVRDASFSYSFGESADEVRFCFTIPYLQTDWQAFINRHQGHPHLATATLCKSSKGRPVEYARMGRVTGTPTVRVLLTARHHACESMASFVLEGLMHSTLTDPELKWLRENVEFLVVPFVDKDGVEDGDQGKLRAPRDHNRDYQGQSIHVTTRALREFVPGWADGKLRLGLDLHCPYIRGQRNEMVYFVGSEDSVNWRNLQEFSNILESLPTCGLPFQADDNLPFGKEWNTAKNYSAGISCAGWARGTPGIVLASSLEVPYANARGTTVLPESARAFGSNLARAISIYLQQPESATPSTSPAISVGVGPNRPDTRPAE